MEGKSRKRVVCKIKFFGEGGFSRGGLIFFWFTEVVFFFKILFLDRGVLVSRGMWDFVCFREFLRFRVVGGNLLFR